MSKTKPASKTKSNYFAHPTAIIEDHVKFGKDVSVWHFSHIRTGASLEDGVSLGRDVYVDKNLIIRKHTRVQNGVSLYAGLEISQYCFIGPHVIFTNDMVPRSTNVNWKVVPTHLKSGSSIGAGAIIVCGVTIGEFALVGAGSIVTQDIPPFHLVMGNPARVKKMVCACGNSFAPLGTPLKKLIKDCCKKNMKADALKFARDTIKKLE